MGYNQNTEGQYRVDLEHNPSRNNKVQHIKSSVAGLIDFVLKHGKDQRTAAIAVTELENAAMWAVKSITKKPRHRD